MDAKKQSNWKTNLPIIVCVVLVVGITILLIFFATSEKITTTGNYPENQHNSSLHCTVKNQDYPFFRYDNSSEKTTTINAIFGDSGLDSLSIIHTLYYDNQREVDGSESQNHAAMGIKFAEDGLGADPFAAHYSKQDGAMSMTLYAKASELTSVAKKYFLIKDNLNANASISAYTKMYQTQNFTCTKSS